MKKTILTGLLILGVISVNAQSKQAQIDANVPEIFNGKWAFLKNSRGVSLDSTKVENGKFSFLAKTDEPMMVNLYLKSDNTILSDKFYIQPGKVKVTVVFNKDHKITEKDISHAGATEIQDKWAAYTNSLSPLQDSVRKIQSKQQAASGKSDTTIRWKLRQEIDQLNGEKKQMQIAYIQNNLNSFVGYLALKDMVSFLPNSNEVNSALGFYNKLSSEIKSYPSVIEFEKNLLRFAAVGIGKLAPNFISTSSNGEKVSLEQFRGKYLLLEFWASWCIPCRAENPTVVKAYNKFHNKNFDILSFSLDKSGEQGKTAWLKAIKDDGMIWNNVSDLEFWNSPIAAMYAVKAVPQNFLIGPDGKIIATNLRGPALEKALEKIFPN